MTKLRNAWTHVALAAMVMASGAAYAQQAANSDPYSGVSQPPPDATITANPDAQPTAPPAAKPSPAVPAAAPENPPAAAEAPVSSVPPAAPAVSPATNTDNDIVTSIPGQSAPPESGSATLQMRNPDADIVSAVPSSANDLPEGTNISVRLTDKLSTRETSVGSPFKGEVARDVYKDGRIIIPAGSELKGRVVGVSQGHHLGQAATLRLRPDVVILPDGTAYHLFAQVAGSDAPGTKTDSEGGIQPKSHLVKNAAEYGVGAGTGAVIGAYVGGPMGAVTGTLIGAGVITAHLLMQHPNAAIVPKGSVVTFSLTEPMELTPTKN
jgi:hypothetical protein